MKNIPISLIFGLIAAVLCIIFALQNADDVTIQYFFWELRMALALVIILSMSVGVVVALAITLPGKIKQKRTINKQNKRIKELEKKAGIEPNNLKK